MNNLPPIISLGTYVPTRDAFSWATFDPSKVVSERELPDYLIMGRLAKGSLKISADGWTARWQGCEADTHFSVRYYAEDKTYMLDQSWCGAEAGGYGRASVGLDKLIAQTCYVPFPKSWDVKAKSELESRFQLTYFEHEDNLYGFSGIPDGAFKTIVFPVSIGNLRPLHKFFSEVTGELKLPYVVGAYSRLLMEAINYVEGRAPDWTREPAEITFRSFLQTGLGPLQNAVRETATDGVSAWTVRRMVYVVFITVPMAGLRDILERLCSKDGPVRYRSYPELPFEMSPIVAPGGFDNQTESISYWDQKGSTRCTLVFLGADKKDKGAMLQAAEQDEATIASHIVAAENCRKELQKTLDEDATRRIIKKTPSKGRVAKTILLQGDDDCIGHLLLEWAGLDRAWSENELGSDFTTLHDLLFRCTKLDFTQEEFDADRPMASGNFYTVEIADPAKAKAELEAIVQELIDRKSKRR